MNNQTPDRAKLARELAALHAGGLSYSQIGKMHGMTQDAAKGLIRHHNLKGTPREFKVIDLGKPLELVGNYLVCGDAHVPALDWEFAHLVSRVAEQKGVDNIAIAGDLLDGQTFSSFAKSSRPVAWAQERDAARVWFQDLLMTFSTITILMGNHDLRLIKWAEGEFDEQDIFGMIMANPKITVSGWSWCTITSDGIPWHVTHPASYSSTQLVVASDIALNYQMNVVSFHEHKLAKGFDRFGRYVVINGGMLADGKKLEYYNKADKRAGKMITGFVSLIDGEGEVYGATPGFTNWRRVLGRNSV